MTDVEVLSRAKCRELFQAAHQAAMRAGIHDVEVTLLASDESLTRFANNEIHQNVSERSSAISIRGQWNQRTARVNTNRLHRDGIQAAVDELAAVVKQCTPNPSLLPLYEPTSGAPDLDRYSPEVADCTPEARAAAVRDAIAVVDSHRQVAAGIYSTAQNVEAILNSEGLFDYHAETLAVFSITATASDSSGWAKASSTALGGFDVRELAARASTKAKLSASPRDAEPGRYTVVLEPAAVLDLVGQIFGDFSGTALDDQKSFLSDRLGQPLFGTNITIWDDVKHPLQAGAPFDGEGVPRSPLLLVERGVPKQVAYCRAAAAKAGTKPTGHGFAVPNETGESPLNIVIAGGGLTLDELLGSTRRGILVTRLWYIREVEPYDKIMTGMTRDGTFLVENGQVVCGLKNFRFNQSVIDLLRNVESMSAPVRASGEEAFDMVVPAMKVHDFLFTERTTF